MPVGVFGSVCASLWLGGGTLLLRPSLSALVLPVLICPDCQWPRPGAGPTSWSTLSREPELAKVERRAQSQLLPHHRLAAGASQGPDLHLQSHCYIKQNFHVLPLSHPLENDLMLPSTGLV